MVDFRLKKDQVYENLRKKIRSGELPPYYHFPPELQLAWDLGVAHNTLRSALARLEKEQLIVRIKSKGTFVNQKFYGKKILALFDASLDKSFPAHYIMPELIASGTRLGFEVESCDVRDFAALKEDELAATMQDKGYAGIILINNNFSGDEPILKLLKSSGLPVVLVHGTLKDYQVTRLPALVVDVPAAWLEAVKYLRSLGFRRILTTAIAYPDGQIRRIPRQEYLQKLAELGIDASEKFLVEFPQNNITILQDKLRRIYRKDGNYPRAILCFSDFTANAIYQVLAELHLRVPEDVAVMGFCGAPIGKLLKPDLSTIDLEYYNIGQMAMELMDRSEQWFDPADSVKAPPLVFTNFHLEKRASTNIRRFEEL